MVSTDWEQGLGGARPVDDLVVEELVHQVAATIDKLSAHRSELSTGDGWVNVDAALSDLYRAMITLQHLDQAPVRTVA
jgi:hypothetical protein